MSRSSRPRRWPLPLGLLGMLGLVAAAEGWLRRHERDFTTAWAAAWDRCGRLVAREAPRCEVLCFGDSLVMHGVAPRVLEARLGRPAHNFAVFKGQAPTAYVLLRRALDAGARPAAVLIDGELLGDDPLELTRLWPELLNALEALELAWTARDAEFFAGVLLGRLLPSARLRFELREGVGSALRGEFASARWGLVPRLRNWRHNLGAHIQPPDFPPPDAVAPTLEQAGYLPTDWRCHPVNAAYVERFLALAGSQGIPVYWLLPPVQPEVQARRDRGGLSAHYERFLRDLAARHRHLVVLDGRHAGFPPEAMSDMTHLNRDGACAFSESLADALRDRLGSPDPLAGERWVALPRYREPSLASAVEDLGQSAEVLRQASAGHIERR